MQKITPFLWFDHQAEEAMNFYVSVFKNSKVLGITHYGDGMPLPKGTVLTANFELGGQPFVALNGGPLFQFSGAISFVINCETQDEVDWYWEKLSEGGRPDRCGWLTVKYGIFWQVVPTILPKFLSSGNAAKTQNAMNAMMQMAKLDIAKLQQAYDQG